MTRSVTSPSPVPSEMLSVHENSWKRELTADGRVYFFDRATGASQWHVPNELYHAKGRLNTPESNRNPFHQEEDLTAMPATARAVLGVDCVTESPPPTRSSMDSRAFANSLLTNINPNAVLEDDEVARLDLEPTEVLRVFINGATGLRDTDFMPGKDKSDPYCSCEILGKPESVVETEVIGDCLDPIWDHEDTVLQWQRGDVIVFTVRDKDDAAQDTNARALSGGIASYDCGDDVLGKVMLSEDDFPLDPSGMLELQLEDAGPGIRATLRVELGIVHAWFQLVGMDQDYARLELASAYPALRVMQFEIPGVYYSVVSWDKVHMKQGYARNFFGAHEDALTLSSLESGDLVEVGGEQYTFDKVGGPHGDAQKFKGKMVRYIYVKETLRKKVMDGARWRKIVAAPEAGFFSDRVCIFSDATTGIVMNVPRVG